METLAQQENLTSAGGGEASLLMRAFSTVETVVSFYGSSLAVVFMMVAIVTEVLSRSLFTHSFMGVVDVTSLAVMMIAFGALSFTQKNKAHIAMDLLTIPIEKKRAGHALQSLNLLIALVCLAVVLYALADRTQYLWQSNAATMTVKVPIWPAATFATIGIVLAVIRFAIDLRARFTGFLRG